MFILYFFSLLFCYLQNINILVMMLVILQNSYRPILIDEEMTFRVMIHIRMHSFCMRL